MRFSKSIKRYSPQKGPDTTIVAQNVEFRFKSQTQGTEMICAC